MDSNELYALQELASTGHFDSLNKLIDYYLENKDYKNAFLTAQRFDYFTTSRGYKTLGYFHQNGIGTEVNIDKAISYYQKSFDMGDISSGYNLALIYVKRKDASKAIEYLASGLENDHIQSIKLLAQLYLSGEGVYKNVDIATNLFKRAIELGDVKSIDALAKAYYSNGDYENSFKYFSMGAQKGDLDCIYHLGVSYAKGLGTRQDFSKALHYYQIGANLFEPRCLYNLSLYYRNGTLVNQNIELANKLEKQAIEKGFKK